MHKNWIKSCPEQVSSSKAIESKSSTIVHWLQKWLFLSKLLGILLIHQSPLITIWTLRVPECSYGTFEEHFENSFKCWTLRNTLGTPRELLGTLKELLESVLDVIAEWGEHNKNKHIESSQKLRKDGIGILENFI